MKAVFIVIITLIFASLTFAQINDIFIGNFLTFDPYYQPPEELEQNWKSFDNNKLFIHLSDEVFFDSSDAQEVVYYENMYGTISNMASSMGSFTVGTINFTIGMPFFLSDNTRQLLNSGCLICHSQGYFFAEYLLNLCKKA